MYCHWMHGALLSVHLFLYYIVSLENRVDCPVTEWAETICTNNGYPVELFFL
jgi:hypothetical protein